MRFPMKLPAIPDHRELQAHIPQIEAVPTGVRRPFWSVMIPVYNCTRYLRRTLASVLEQNVNAEDMQIEVVDGCSTKDDPEQVVNEFGKSRVGFYRLSAN